MVDAALFGSAWQRWRTPDLIFTPLHREFDFEIDLAAEPCNARLPIYLTANVPTGGALAVESLEGARGWCNSPFGRGGITGRWVEWLHRQARDHGATIAALLPARTDTRWFHEHVLGCAEIRFVVGRVTFGDADTGEPAAGPAPFPTLIAIWRPGAEVGWDPPAPRSWDPRIEPARVRRTA